VDLVGDHAAGAAGFCALPGGKPAAARLVKLDRLRNSGLLRSKLLLQLCQLELESGNFVFGLRRGRLGHD
jgi:hypothetical protein